MGVIFDEVTGDIAPEPSVGPAARSVPAAREKESEEEKVRSTVIRLQQREGRLQAD